MASLTMRTELFLQLSGRLAAPCLADHAARPLRHQPRARDHRGRHQLSKLQRYPRFDLVILCDISKRNISVYIVFLFVILRCFERGRKQNKVDQ